MSSRMRKFFDVLNPKISQKKGREVHAMHAGDQEKYFDHEKRKFVAICCNCQRRGHMFAIIGVLSGRVIITIHKDADIQANSSLALTAIVYEHYVKSKFSAQPFPKCFFLKRQPEVLFDSYRFC